MKKTSEAVAVSSGLGTFVEDAMSKAVTDAYRQRITDPEKVRALMAEARAKARREFFERRERERLWAHGIKTAGSK